MRKQVATFAVAITVGLIAGCGGSGTNTPTTSISGKVADGYLVNATVFIDKNGNYQLDVGEPSTATDTNGAYTLNVDSADVGKYPIVALALKGQTIDKDSNQTVPNSYVLSMPATAISGTTNSNFISPMSSQLRELMATGKYATMQDAMNDLSHGLGMPTGTNMLTDYMDPKNIASNNLIMHTAAQNMAGLMGSQMAQVLSTNGSTNTVDVNRYRSMMGAVFSSISSVKGSSSNTQSAMLNLRNTMTANLQNITPGQPYRNMSTAFRGGMMGGASVSNYHGAATGTTTVPDRMM